MNYITFPIFVFGSNLAGQHSKGAALVAVKKFGARYGQGVGRQGHSYAIPTKDQELKTLPVAIIAQYVEEFCRYAYNNGEESFEVTKIGCGLAGYSEGVISPMFKDAPKNCILPEGWR